MVVDATDAVALGRDVGGAVRTDADRWIFVFMAALFVATARVGFIPSSIEKVAAVEASQRPPFPPALHVHAVLMGSWLMLLLTQTSLMATGRGALHQRLGIVSFVLMPAMIVAGLILVPTMWRLLWSIDTTVLPAPAAASIAESKTFVSNILLLQIRMGIMFPLCVVWALRARRKDPETHKRLMILATVVPLAAAIDRIVWLPTTLPHSPVAPDLYVLLWILPMFAFDIVRHRRVPRAYLIWAGVGLPLTIAAHLLWERPGGWRPHRNWWEWPAHERVPDEAFRLGVHVRTASAADRKFKPPAQAEPNRGTDLSYGGFPTERLHRRHGRQLAPDRAREHQRRDGRQSRAAAVRSIPQPRRSPGARRFRVHRDRQHLPGPTELDHSSRAGQAIDLVSC